MIIAVIKSQDIEFNKAAEETFGYTHQELLGNHVAILYADPEKCTNAITKQNHKPRYVPEL